MPAPTLRSLSVSAPAQVFNLDPRRIVLRAGWNVRDLLDIDNAAHVASLAQSIAEVGVRSPLTVFLENDYAVLTDGHCRLMAVLKCIDDGIEIATVPCISEPRGSNEADHVASQLIRNSGKPLSPLEQGSVYARLVRYGWSSATIAEKTGKSVAHVNQMLVLHATPPEVRALIASGQVSGTLAGEAVRRHGARAAEALTEAVATAAATGRTRATRRHLRADNTPHTLDIFEEARRSWGNEMLGITIDALRRIRDLPPPIISQAHNIAREALAEIEEDGVTGATGPVAAPTPAPIARRPASEASCR